MPRPFNPNTYKGWRKLVLQRDNHKCIQCGSEEKLECDHILNFRDYPDLRYEVSNGRTLCRYCHKKTETYGGKMLKGRRIDGNLYGSR